MKQAISSVSDHDLLTALYQCSFTSRLELAQSSSIHVVCGVGDQGREGGRRQLARRHREQYVFTCYSVT